MDDLLFVPANTKNG